MANLLNDYPAQRVVTGPDFYAQLRTYAATQFKNGKPYVAEAHSADSDQWIYDSADHSEDYFHSTYVDPVISGLLGIRPSDGNVLTVNPLTPAQWTHFALENVPYHGHNVTVEYDRDGTAYHVGRGYHVFVDGRVVANAAVPGKLTIRIQPGPPQQAASDLVNDAANPLRAGYPAPIASDTWYFDDAWNALDGKVWFNEVPENTRWSNYSSPNAGDYYGVDFGVPTSVSDVRFYGYDDGDGVRPAAGYTLQYWTGSGWLEVPEQTHTPQVPVGNGLNRITFTPLTTSRIRLLFDNPPGAFVGVTELQSWSESSAAASLRVASRVTVLPGQSATVATTLTANQKPLQQAEVSLTVPPGWTATATTPAASDRVALGHPLVTAWTVTAPPDAVGQPAAPLAAVAHYRQGRTQLVTHSAGSVSIGFDPRLYPVTLADDRFATDASSRYTVRQPFPNEVIPTVDSGNGTLRATADRPFFALFDSGITPAAADSVVIVTADSFIGSSAPNQDSLFVGLGRDGQNYVTAWYNNHFSTSGVDVRVAGGLNPAVTGTCCTSVRMVPGDQLAAQFHGTVVTVFLGHAGTWTRLESTDVGAVVDQATLAGNHAVFGLRGDPGSIAVRRFQVLRR